MSQTTKPIQTSLTAPADKESNQYNPDRDTPSLNNDQKRSDV